MTDVVQISRIDGTAVKVRCFPPCRCDEQHLWIHRGGGLAKDHSRRLRRVLDRVMKGHRTHVTVQAARYSALTRIDGGTLGAASGQKSSNSRNSCSTSLAREVGRVGVTVNAIAPGFIDTEMTGGLAGSDRDRVAGRSALRRLAAPEDIAAMAALLVGESGRNITGAVMTVDAGGTA